MLWILFWQLMVINWGNAVLVKVVLPSYYTRSRSTFSFFFIILLCCSNTILFFIQLKRFGRIVLALEGGYNLEALSNGVASCMKVLLGDEDCATFDTSELPYSSTWKTILNVCSMLFSIYY